MRNTFANICAILRNAEEYGERLRYNEMLIAPTLDGHAMQEAELGLMREAIERRYGFSPAPTRSRRRCSRLRGSGGITPSATTSLELQWDGTERLDALCASVLHAEPSPINRTMVRAWFISAVARAMDPRCKCDTAMVLVGEQGVRKSTFYRVLAGEWFSDTAVDIESKDSMMQINGAWIYELGEIEHVTGRAHAAHQGVHLLGARYVPRAVPPHAFGLPAVVRDRGINERGPVPQRPYGLAAILVHPAWASAWTSTRSARQRDQLWAEAVAAYRTQRRGGSRRRQRLRCARRARVPRGRPVGGGDLAMDRGPQPDRPATPGHVAADHGRRARTAPVGHRPARREPRRGGDEAPGVGQSPEWIDGRTQRVWNRKDVTP